MKFGFFLREALRAMRRSAAPSFAALATVLVTMLVLGVFIPIVQATNGAAASVRSRVLVDVYLKNDANPSDVARVKRELLAVPHVEQVEGSGCVDQAAHWTPSFRLVEKEPILAVW